jgi:hypothetical protein
VGSCANGEGTYQNYGCVPPDGEQNCWQRSFDGVKTTDAKEGKAIPWHKQAPNRAGID